MPRGGSSSTDGRPYRADPIPAHFPPPSATAADSPMPSNDNSVWTEDPSQYWNNGDENVEGILHETVQDRVDSWRQAQMAQAKRLQQSARDEQGRLKLLTGVSRGSRAIIFVCLVFRNLHLFEVADQRLKAGWLRLLVVTPLVALFVANLAGVVASFTAPSHSANKRLKAILNLDKLLEACLIAWNLSRLTLAPSPYVPREIYVSSALHSAFFILQCQAFTRLTWDENAAAKPHDYVAAAQQQQQPLPSDPSAAEPLQSSEEWYYGNDYQRLGDADEGPSSGQRSLFDSPSQSR